MGRELREGWTAVEDSQLWLAMLVGAMEDAVRPERRALPCAGSTLAELGAQLARPMPSYPQSTSPQGTAASSRD